MTKEPTFRIQRDGHSRVALGEEPRSWADLMRDVHNVAERLPARPGDEILLLCTDRYLFAVCLLAAWRLGCPVVLPPNGQLESTRALKVESSSRLVVHDGQGEGFDVAEILERVSQHASTAGVQSIEVEPSRHLVTIYTSGSSGVPVSCPKTGTQVLGEAELLANLFGIGSDCRAVVTAPSHHIYGLLFGVLAPLMGGGAFSRATPQYPDSIGNLCDMCQANVVVSTPAHLAGLAVLPTSALSGIRRIFSSGAPLPQRIADSLQDRLGLVVTEILGSSETGGIAWRMGQGDPAWRPLPCVRVSADQDGLILLQSPFLQRSSDAWFAGDDRIQILQDGRFLHLGRSDAIVKIGGERVSVREVEERLLSIDGVDDAVVAAIPVDGLRQYELWAAVVAPSLRAGRLRAELLRFLDPIAVPRRFRLVGRLPREQSGKITRQVVEELFDQSADETP